MNPRLLAFLILFLSLQGICEATNSTQNETHWDARVESFARHYPIGAFLRGDIGYSLKTWDARKDTAKKSPLYGMIRPHVQFQTSGVINSVRSFVEVHPISFLSLYVGREYAYRSSKKLHTIDCETTNCDTGSMKRNHWGAKMAMKVGPVFYLGRFQWHTTTLSSNPFSTYVEEQGTLLGQGKRDTIFYQTHVLGYQWSDEQGVGILYKRNRMKSTHDSSVMSSLLYRHVWPKHGLSVNAGPGIFRERHGHLHYNTMISMLYMIEPGLSLF